MTDVQEQATEEAAPEAIQRGRYAVFAGQTGQAVIAYTDSLCESCQACTCGVQQEPVDLSPAGLLGLADRLGIGGGVVKSMMKMIGMGR